MDLLIRIASFYEPSPDVISPYTGITFEKEIFIAALDTDSITIIMKCLNTRRFTVEHGVGDFMHQYNVLQFLGNTHGQKIS